MKRRVFLYGAFALLIAPRRSEATWKPQYASEPQSVQDWYANAQLTPAAQKRLGFVPCCDTSEVVKTKFRVAKTNGDDEWFYLDHGTWREVPPDIIHWNESAPSGQPTLFILKDQTADVWHLPHGTPTCFYPPPPGI